MSIAIVYPLARDPAEGHIYDMLGARALESLRKIMATSDGDKNAHARANAEAAARVLAQALCNCGKWDVVVPLTAHRPDCRYRVEVEKELKEREPHLPL